MDYKAYYSFKAKAEKKIETINFDYVNIGEYVFDVHDADGLDHRGKTAKCSGSSTFTCEVDDEPAEIDWESFADDLEDMEAVFSLFDEDDEPIDFDDAKFELLIYDDSGNKIEGETDIVFAGNM